MRISSLLNLRVVVATKLSIPRNFSTFSIPAAKLFKMVDVDSEYKVPLDQPFVSLDCTEAFQGLTDKEKKYSHFLSKASWAGSFVVAVQTSPESPVIVSLLLDLFNSNGIEQLKKIAINECSFTEEDWTALLVYTGALFCNMGNYKGFGDTKFVPGVSAEKLGRLIGKAKFESQPHAQDMWSATMDQIYRLGSREKQLGLGEKGVTTYFSANCNMDDADLVKRFLKSQSLEGWNTRCFKTVGTNGIVTYEIRSASSQESSATTEFNFESCKFVLTQGDYAPLMALLNSHLKQAQEFTSNPTESSMLDCYIDSFTNGEICKHKDGSRYWIKDKGPVIETYIGFIENYRDPAGVRAEFEGFVAVVNRETSKKFQALVDGAPTFLTLLPWGKEFEKEKFLKPDFTSLDVLTFGGSGIPAGINIPNYDEIRQHEGFKNVSLGNVIPANYKDTKLPFLSSEDADFLNKYRIPAFEVQVALHELLGHGSGILFMEKEDGSKNFSPDLINPVTGRPIESFYHPGDNYDSVFGSIGSAFEECRAECVGLYLSLDKPLLDSIFGYKGEHADNIIYANWLSMVFAGAAKALEMYQPAHSAWTQAHSQARFSIMQVLVEAGQGLVEITESVGEDGKPDLKIKLDQSKIATVGKEAIRDYLLKIQVYKATADVDAAQKMFGKYTKVDDCGTHPWAKWRDIVMAHKTPRKYFVQPNTAINADVVALKTYPASPEGLIESWTDRFDAEEAKKLHEGLRWCWLKDQAYFKS